MKMNSDDDHRLSGRHLTPAAPRNSAAKKVWQINELLISILHLVGMRTLLSSAQRVCRHWHAVVQSKRFQKALFLEPDTDATVFVHNPLLMEIFPFAFEHLHLGPDEPVPLYTRTTRIPNRTRDFPSVSHIVAKEEAFGRPEATWRRMLPRQPPVSHYAALQTMGSSGACCSSRRYIKDHFREPSVVTALDLLSGALCIDPDHLKISSFRVLWYGDSPEVIYPNTMPESKRTLLRTYFAQSGVVINTFLPLPAIDSEPHPGLAELRRIVGPISRPTLRRGEWKRKIGD